MLSKINHFNCLLSVSFISLIFILILSQIILRIFGLYIPSLNEICGYLLVTSFFLILGKSIENDKHIRVSLLFEVNNPRLSHIAQLACYSAASFLSLFITYACLSLTLDSYYFHEVSSGELPILEWPIQAIMVYGSLISTLTIIRKLLGVHRGHH